jgi:hypothetical protein
MRERERGTIEHLHLEPQIAFPRVPCFSVRRGDFVRVTAILDGLHTVFRIEFPEIGSRPGTAHHATYHSVAPLGIAVGHVPARCLLQESQQVGTFGIVLDALERS